MVSAYLPTVEARIYTHTIHGDKFACDKSKSKPRVFRKYRILVRAFGKSRRRNASQAEETRAGRTQSDVVTQKDGSFSRNREPDNMLFKASIPDASRHQASVAWWSRTIGTYLATKPTMV